MIISTIDHYRNKYKIIKIIQMEVMKNLKKKIDTIFNCMFN